MLTAEQDPSPAGAGVLRALPQGEHRAPGWPRGVPARSIPSCTVSICGQGRGHAELLLGLPSESELTAPFLFSVLWLPVDFL